jgi:TonB family protein
MYPISTNAPEHGPMPVAEFQDARDHSAGFLRHFGFHESPFGVTPNPAFLFSSRLHFSALQSLIQSIESNLGFAALLGEPGMGKTTLLLQLLAQYRDSARTAFIFQTQCKRYELLRHLASELELPVMKRDEVSLHRRLKEMLVDEARAGRKVLIFIDEAQNLQHSSLEAIRLLSDFETARAKLLHIVLSDSARLGEMLLAPELSQLAQRISTVCRLEPFTPEEVNSYIAFRLRVAGCKTAESLFSPESLGWLAEHSEGVPRVVNSICYRALSLAYSRGERHVNATLVRQAARDLDLSRSPRPMNSNVWDHFPRTEKPPGTIPLPEPCVSKPERRASLDSAEWGVKAPEAASAEKIQLGAAANSIQQPPSLPLQEKAIPEATQKARPMGGAGQTRRNLAWRTQLLETFRAKGWGFQNDQLLVLSAIILVALGLWTGWRELRARSGALPGPAEANAIANSSQDQNWTFPLSDMLYSPMAAGKSNPDRKFMDGNKTHAPAIQTLPQSLLPSKLRPQTADATEATPPAATPHAAAAANNLPLALLNDPRPLPQPPPAPGAMAEPSLNSAAKNSEATNADQASARQPIRIVQPKYPKLAELARIEGNVLLELHVDSKGRVETARALSGNALLREAAEEAARRWQYPPSSGNQSSTAMVTRVRVNFKLKPETRR